MLMAAAVVLVVGMEGLGVVGVVSARMERRSPLVYLWRWQLRSGIFWILFSWSFSFLVCWESGMCLRCSSLGED